MCVFLMPFFAAFRMVTEMINDPLLLDGKVEFITHPIGYRCIF